MVDGNRSGVIQLSGLGLWEYDLTERMIVLPQQAELGDVKQFVKELVGKNKGYVNNHLWSNTTGGTECSIYPSFPNYPPKNLGPLISTFSPCSFPCGGEATIGTMQVS